MFDKFKDIMALQKQAKQIKKDLGKTHIEAEEGGVIVTINGEQEVISVKINPEHPHATDTKKLEADLQKAFNKAIKKSQEIAAEMMKGVLGGFNLPGMGDAN